MLTEPLSAGLEKYLFTQFRRGHVSFPIAQINMMLTCQLAQLKHDLLGKRAGDQLMLPTWVSVIED